MMPSYLQKYWLKRPNTGWDLAAAVVVGTTVLEVERMCREGLWGGSERGICCLVL